jgi:hypothetical protein
VAPLICCGNRAGFDFCGDSYRGYSMRKLLLTGVAAAMLTAASVGAASAANLVQNGDFNSPGAESAVLLQQGNTFVTDWTNHDQYTGYIPKGQTADQSWSGLTGSAGPGYGVANGLVGPPSGNAQMVIDGTEGFGPTGGFGYIEQSVAGLVSGDTYTLSYWFAGSQEFGAGGATTQSFVVHLGDQTFTSPTLDVAPNGFAPWQEVSATFTWDGVGNALQFMSVGSGEPAFTLLADVSLTGGGGPATPEASTWVMIIAGFAGMGFLARTRRKAVAVA